MDNNEDPPLGQRLRDLINPALEDARRQDHQLKTLDRIFGTLADKLPDILSRELGSFFNHAARIAKEDPDRLNLFVLDMLSLSPPGKDGPGCPAIVRTVLPYTTSFTDFSAREIKALPNYIRLHQVLRDMDIAVQISGLTGDEVKSHQGQVVITLDLSKPYAAGALENSLLYPDLPPPTPQVGWKKSGSFDL